MRLSIRDGSGEERIVDLEGDDVTLGKHAECGLVLPDAKVSRRHARIVVRGGEAFVSDLGSTNGTHVNGERISEETVLVPGDQMRLGSHEIRVESTTSPDDTPTGDVPVVAPPAEAVETEAGDDAVEAEALSLTDDEKKAQMFWASMESFFGPIWKYVESESVSEIMVNGPREIFYEEKGQLHRSPDTFTEEGLRAAIMNIAQFMGRRVNEENPYLDARLPDGSRVAVVLPPCSRKGPCIAIRKFAKEKLTIQNLIDFGSMNQEVVDFLDVCMKLRKNTIISGGTSSGKTSLLNVISALIPNEQRVIVVEDSAELQLHGDHVLPLESKPPDKRGRGEVTLRELVRASLRLRPDRIVVGEVRGGEALDLLQAMNTGHSGSLATTHASSPLQSMSRLETLTLFSGLDLPIVAIREQVSTAVDMVVQAARLHDGSRKVTHVSEVLTLTPDGKYRVQDIYRFVRTGTGDDGKIIGEHQAVGNLPTFYREIEMGGLEVPAALAELAAKPGALEALEESASAG